MINRRTLLAAAAGIVLAAGIPVATLAAEPLKVVASFSILGDMVSEIGGDAIVVTTLVGPDGDAHVYEPTPGDASSIAAADILVVNGLDFESWVPRLVGAAGFKGVEVVASAGVTPRAFGDHDEDDHDDAADAEDHDHDHDHDEAEHDDHDDHDDAAGGHPHHHGANDPHAWQNLANGVIYARNIAAALAKADPDNAATYEANAAAYVAELEAMDAEVKAAFAVIPPERRKVVTSHDAFGYFADAYGVEFIAPTGVSTDAEASAADVARIIDQIRHDAITAVFVENISDTRLVDQIASETGAAIGGALFSDALSGPDGPAPTYLDMFRWNTEQLTQALGTS
jgi:zinc/manganese transport system substrate-binding protein